MWQSYYGFERAGELHRSHAFGKACVFLVDAPQGLLFYSRLVVYHYSETVIES